MGKLATLALAERPQMEAPMQQADLFSGANLQAKLAFVNIDNLDQDSLLDIVALNSVKIIADLRAAPVFKRPVYDHKSIISYFFKYGVQYVEFAVGSLQKGSETVALSDLASLCASENKSGVALIIYDGTAEREQRPALMRKFLARHEAPPVELSCRALRGYRTR